MRLLPLLVGALTLVLTGCSYKINEHGGLSAHKITPLEQGNFIPTKGQLGENKIKVVVFPLANKAPKAKSAGAGEAASGMVEKYVLESGNVELIDRESVTKLQNEIALAEMSGKTLEGEGMTTADFAVMGEVSGVTNRSFFWPEGRPEYMLLNALVAKATKKEQKGAPMFEYTVGVRGQIKIFRLPEAVVVKTVDFEESRSMSKMAGISLGNLRVSVNPPALTPLEEQGLISSAVMAGVDDIQRELKSFFTKKGYIVEKRVSENGKETLFLVSFGGDNRVKEGDRVAIFTHESYHSKITDKTTLDEVKVGEGKVSDIVKGGECWIHVGEKEVANKIRFGDFVKINYGGSFAKMGF